MIVVVVMVVVVVVMLLLGNVDLLIYFDGFDDRDGFVDWNCLVDGDCFVDGNLLVNVFHRFDEDALTDGQPRDDVTGLADAGEEATCRQQQKCTPHSSPLVRSISFR